MRSQSHKWKLALQHLRKDPTLKIVIARVGEISIKKDFDLYRALLNAIVGQQLSVKAADTIWKRFLGIFSDAYPSAEAIIELDIEKMRASGLSYQKAGYIKNIAHFSIEKSLEYKNLKKLSDEELITYLTQIKGVGRWTAEMILMFNLQQMDVFPKDDLGIQNGITELYQLNYTNKKELLLLIELEAAKWSPYRSVACMYIWRYKDSKKADT